jgi:FdhD protein
MNPAVHPVDIVRVGPGAESPGHDVAATEEPLEIRLGDRPFVVIMRTPGHDHELAAGFLLAEQIVQHSEDIGSIRHCTDADGVDLDHAGNVLSVWLTGEAATRAAAMLVNRRNVTSNSSCGVCGRKSIDDLLCGARRIDAAWTMSRAEIAAMPERLREAQAVFAETGGLHAAGLFDRQGRLIQIAEDVGRHNAVDKVIGRELLAGRVPLSDHVLFVSGRTSFEIVQKALVAGIPVVASVSAPSSLAIELARDGNLTLLGFVRGSAFNMYSATERITV